MEMPHICGRWVLPRAWQIVLFFRTPDKIGGRAGVQQMVKGLKWNG